MLYIQGMYSESLKIIKLVQFCVPVSFSVPKVRPLEMSGAGSGMGNGGHRDGFDINWRHFPPDLSYS